jgi:hypothetical protein
MLREQLLHSILQLHARDDVVRAGTNHKFTAEIHGSIRVALRGALDFVALDFVGVIHCPTKGICVGVVIGADNQDFSSLQLAPVSWMTSGSAPCLI